MAIKECPICGVEIDKRGYTQHIRKCKELKEKQNEENTSMSPEDEKKDEIKEPEVIEASPAQPIVQTTPAPTLQPEPVPLIKQTVPPAPRVVKPPAQPPIESEDEWDWWIC